MVSGVDPQRAGLDAAVRVEVEAGQAAEGGDVLILLADRLAEEVDLDAAGLLRRARAGGPVRGGA